MVPAVLDVLTYRQFTNMVNGYRKEKDLESRERFVIMRKMMWAALMPDMKKGFQEKDIISFPWEQKMIKKITLEENAKLMNEVEMIKNFYSQQDAKKNEA